MRFKAENLQKFEILGCFGDYILDRFGTNRCKKSEWLKTGLRVAASEFRNGGVGPLTQDKQAIHLTAT